MEEEEASKSKKGGKEEDEEKDKDSDATDDENSEYDHSKPSQCAEDGECAAAADPTEARDNEAKMTLGKSAQTESESKTIPRKNVSWEKSISLATSSQPKEDDQATRTMIGAPEEDAGDESETSVDLDVTATVDADPTPTLPQTADNPIVFCNS